MNEEFNNQNHDEELSKSNKTLNSSTVILKNQKNNPL